MRIALALPAVVALQFCAACGQDSYRPFYYPDRANLTKFTRGPLCVNAGDARQWAKDQAAQRRDSNWDYEIGKNCKPMGDGAPEVCDETLK